MKQLLIVIAIITSTLSTFASEMSTKETTTNKKYPYPFKYSDVVSDNISLVPQDRVVKDWGGNVLMWGEPAASEVEAAGVNLKLERLKVQIAKGREDGVRLYMGGIFFVPHSNIYFKYLAADPTLQEAAIRDIEGKRMLLAWMVDHTYRGVPQYWTCSNNPRSREFYRECVTAAMEAGYDGICIEEPRGSSVSLFAGGCFCDHCMEGFHDYLEKKFTPEELKQKGILNIEDFDYREMVRDVADTREAWVRAYRQGKIPLVADFQDFQVKAAAALVKEMRELAKRMGGEDIIVGAFGAMLGPTWLVNSQYLDFYCSEHKYGPPPEGYKQVTFTYELARALEKPISWSNGNPTAWTYLKQNKAFNMVKGWIALSYAFGHNFGIPHYGWAFPRTKVERWDRHPKNSESCTPHFLLPTEDYIPFYQFVTRNAELFDDYEAVEQVGVLYSHAAIRKRKNEVHNVCWSLLKTNIPYGLALAGDDWLANRLTEKDLSKFEFVVVPEPIMLEGEQQRVLDEWTAKGRAVPWKDVDDVLTRIEPFVSLKSKSNILIRPRKNPSNSTVPVVIHLLNLDYDLAKDAMNRQTDITICLAHKLMDDRDVRSITLLSPESESIQVPFENKPDGVYVSIPEVDIWGMLKLECD